MRGPGKGGGGGESRGRRTRRAAESLVLGKDCADADRRGGKEGQGQGGEEENDSGNEETKVRAETCRFPTSDQSVSSRPSWRSERRAASGARWALFLLFVSRCHFLCCWSPSRGSLRGLSLDIYIWGEREKGQAPSRWLSRRIPIGGGKWSNTCIGRHVRHSACREAQSWDLEERLATFRKTKQISNAVPASLPSA